ncbi:autotransporter outer membrane beta-barrel domain-containing protein [Agrobacterium larrymoorei]|uniref:Outer membrane autotransporter protein n=1 Tax=Agrobacterium larrymoorei TaxID=160699 RepID=A0ABU0UGS2_9HYPH|nr:autotransporter outer membrane beta-barrel domain-containing protein [Agrobacterium larrymoorei]MDQ1184141.1 outer membrane autotransporter protein [Agrobacterium larrymoorei]
MRRGTGYIASLQHDWAVKPQAQLSYAIANLRYQIVDGTNVTVSDTRS